MRFITHSGVVALAVAAVLSGCSGSEKPGKVFTAADVTRIANVRPVTAGWAWPRDPEKSDSSDSPTEAQSTVLGEAGNTWRDDDKLANLAVGVLASASHAHEALAELNAYSRGLGERSGDITKDEEIDGLGDEAWVLWVEGNGREVTYHWRRGNLFVEAHVHCFGFCPGDVDAAARAWVDAIDQEARTG